MENKDGIICRKKHFSIDNIIIDNNVKIAKEFNYFFDYIGPILAKYITYNVNPLFYVNSVNDSIVVKHVSVAQVKKFYHIAQGL